MFGVSPYIYNEVYYWCAFVLCALIFLRYSVSDNNKLLLQQNTIVPALLLSVLAILFLGLRPTHYRFGDMVTYAAGYRAGRISGVAIESKGEWVFAWFQQVLINLGQTEEIFFLLCAFGYIYIQYWACQKLLWENVWIAMLFILSAFEFYEFAVNGVRNGLACAIVMMAMTIAIQAKGRYLQLLLALLIAYLAFGIHKSTIIPSACAIAALYFIKNPKYALYIWVASIFVSLVAGGFFVGLVGDMMSGEAKYADYTGNSTEASFSRSGFRWDFLLYSAMPVLLIYYVNIKKKIRERVFDYLAVTYLLANSFWILVIRVNYTNRFAYLSWFLYPLVLAYGLIRLHIWEDQDRKIGLFLLLHAGFTLFMFLIGKL